MRLPNIFRNKFMYIPLALLLIASAPLTEHQEIRARALFHGLRCVVCEGQSVADSPAEVAVDIRNMVREHIAKGESDVQIKQQLVAVYGPRVLMRPVFSLSTAILWLAPLISIILGVVIIFAYYASARAGRK